MSSPFGVNGKQSRRGPVEKIGFVLRELGCDGLDMAHRGFAVGAIIEPHFSDDIEIWNKMFSVYWVRHALQIAPLIMLDVWHVRSRE